MAASEKEQFEWLEKNVEQWGNDFLTEIEKRMPYYLVNSPLVEVFIF